MRTAEIKRETKETNIELRLDLDGTGQSDIKTGVGFFDHMLTLFAFHSRIDLTVQVEGDTWVDAHHTVEDVGIALGQMILEALGDKVGIRRYGTSYLPMDETLARAVIDVSGRPFLVYRAEINNPKLGDFDTELAEEFFRAVAMNARLTLHLDVLYGSNSHHMIEGLFKAFGRALAEAIGKDGLDRLPSTKGRIEG
ncbi:imidazoleglycerol-phosphate dehydratase HisB [Exiguobacterium sp. SH3S2]|uniref:imidazoleglycerol-phosphate dehydratase HisB n=1 Tax=Exiguobacterium TaxID=33986 RepID=UPI0008777591|nr:MULTISPECIES: imidazoleglycerol-phosphate dehydratase HisB [Exiguobacterium]OGX80722.1 imidazoleglycerol-phosphate dehydratase [Exiguobacterium sp. SH31]TCI24968.1 imidazoleglycerol-phosphate dehydratase HisB [Exiguobacterium sp. SH5S4]TCI35594.1 imidazoleglycerol-phosphate dehydratase HisB [Exiguobacterium sp. SH4S7]TCI43610.1 imidazoleglycerol-phosphate dehydratase HisB [Exiguobacterium sp. SH5S32]TCI45622.1 imidazoleglycerol-phosphate dehydratase HisB [Exiguobacterium sp. SH3S3]